MMVKVYHKQEKGKSIVEIADLTVFVTGSDDEGWLAQGLEIDYFICAKTEASVIENFLEGLSKTIVLHITENGNIESLLIPAPPEVWREYYDFSNKAKLTATPAQIKEQVLPNIHKINKGANIYIPEKLAFITA